MFNVKNFTLPRPQKLAEVLNYTLADLVCHGKCKPGFRFIARSNDVAYLKAPGEPKGAVCVYLGEGELQAVIYYHPSRTGKEAWEMAATDEGCRTLVADEDMEEDRAWVNSRHEPYYPPRLGESLGLYDVVSRCMRFL